MAAGAGAAAVGIPFRNDYHKVLIVATCETSASEYSSILVASRIIPVVRGIVVDTGVLMIPVSSTVLVATCSTWYQGTDGSRSIVRILSHF